MARLEDAATRAQLIRFGLVGGLNTGFSYGVYALGLFVGLSFYLASLLALILGIMVSFFTQGRLVFQAQLEGRFVRFVAIWAVLYLVNIALIWVLAKTGMSYYLAGLVAFVPIVALSFLLQKFVVFKE